MMYRDIEDISEKRFEGGGRFVLKMIETERKKIIQSGLSVSAVGFPTILYMYIYLLKIYLAMSSSILVI